MNELNELKLQAEIDKRVGKLVEIGEELVKNLGPKVKGIEANQIRNVLAVANTAPHSSVVTNFIVYQMGRKGPPGAAWKETRLGEALIKVIDEQVRQLAADAALKANTSHVDEVQVRMTRLLLGFLNRRYVYEKEK